MCSKYPGLKTIYHRHRSQKPIHITESSTLHHIYTRDPCKVLLPGDQIPLHDAHNDSSGVFHKQLLRNRLESPVVHDTLEAFSGRKFWLLSYRFNSAWAVGEWISLYGTCGSTSLLKSKTQMTTFGKRGTSDHRNETRLLRYCASFRQKKIYQCPKRSIYLVIALYQRRRLGLVYTRESENSLCFNYVR